MRLQALVIALGVPLGLLVLAFISPEQLDEMPVLCIWKRLTGHPCPGCGMTHAVTSVMQADFRGAYQFNRGIVILIPLTAWLWAAQVRLLWTSRKSAQNTPLNES
jgi:hypothetical protein